MKKITKDGITILTDLDDMTDEEFVKFSDAVIKHNGGTLKDIIKIEVKDRQDGTVDVSYDKTSTVKFERIARVSE